MTATLWERYQQYRCSNSALGMELDVSRVSFTEEFLETIKAPRDQARKLMACLEAGEKVNEDEGRMVGHYWLRNPSLAPDPKLTELIERSFDEVSAFASKIHSGEISAPNGSNFTDVLLVGIGGSALGPQLLADFYRGQEYLNLHVIDNTDSDGIAATLAGLPDPATALVVVISKSGGTKETRNGMLLTKYFFAEKGLNFAKHAVAVTGEGSALDGVAASENWLASFPMWDWVGGRTSLWSAVGLVPGLLLGVPMKELLDGAAALDEWSRQAEADQDPALLLASMWHYLTKGVGEKAMVVLPYKDRMGLLGKYLQQLVMESLGKQFDTEGKEVFQGIAVYGNKGSTDQHSYIQQLREGPNNYFAFFVDVLADEAFSTPADMVVTTEVDPGIQAGDYLHGFYLGTREALYQNGRESITLTLNECSPKTLGATIALFERAVSYYAGMVNINAYHQPGVEAGKKAAERVVALQKRITSILKEKNQPTAFAELVSSAGSDDISEDVYRICRYLAHNGRVAFDGDLAAGDLRVTIIEEPTV